MICYRTRIRAPYAYLFIVDLEVRNSGDDITWFQNIYISSLENCKGVICLLSQAARLRTFKSSAAGTAESFHPAQLEPEPRE